jgi:argininosuccinate lyase
MLHRVGLVDADEQAAILDALDRVEKELTTGAFVFAPTDEDIHTAIERRVTELAGDAGAKLHTGRSRNDQVATDFRLWLLEILPLLDSAILDLQSALLQRAETDFGAILPGYTHLQRAQPILLSHWWLSHFWPLQRDRQRLGELRQRAAVLPLGSGALAGTPFPVDRIALAAELGFDQPSPNSLDAVSDRDFAAEFLFCAALAGVHLSRLAEAVVLFTSAEFGYFELSDAFSTGSSLMPQKKNPDPFELARGKAGSLLGDFTGLMATLKGLPSAYDKDLQEDKLPVFHAFDTLAAILPVLANAIRSLQIHPEAMRRGIDAGMLATDLADYLVKKGVPFRQAHALAGQAVQRAAEREIPLDQLALEEFRGLSPAFEPDVYAVFDPVESISRRSAEGGTAPQAVRKQIQMAEALLAGRPPH